jgi:excisionase family DNA binding protein
MYDPPPTKLAYNVRELCAALGVGKSKAYAMIADGSIPSIEFAGKTLIVVEDIKQLLLDRPRAVPKGRIR